MKKILFSLLVMFVTIGASAQGQRREFNPEDMAKRQAERVKEACNTTDEQYTAIYNLYLEQAMKQKAERDSIMAAGNNNERPRFNREDMEKRRNEMNEKIKAILTADQYKAYEEAQKQMRERRGQRGGGGPRE